MRIKPPPGSYTIAVLGHIIRMEISPLGAEINLFGFEFLWEWDEGSPGGPVLLPKGLYAPFAGMLAFEAPNVVAIYGPAFKGEGLYAPL